MFWHDSHFLLKLSCAPTGTRAVRDCKCIRPTIIDFQISELGMTSEAGEPIHISQFKSPFIWIFLISGIVEFVFVSQRSNLILTKYQF